MRIVRTFTEELYAIHYQGQVDNEYDRLMELWTDVSYLRSYAKKNNIQDINTFVTKRLQDAEDIQDKLDELSEEQLPLDHFFIPFHNQEYSREILLSQRKGKIERNGLRIYAVKVHDNCFVITGGIIKMSQATQGNDENNKEIDKLKFARDYLKNKDVFDDATFYELLKEQE